MRTYYLHGLSGDEVTGPHKEAFLIGMAISGEISRQAMVTPEGEEDWRPLSEHIRIDPAPMPVAASPRRARSYTPPPESASSDLPVGKPPAPIGDLELLRRHTAYGQLRSIGNVLGALGLLSFIGCVLLAVQGGMDDDTPFLLSYGLGLAISGLAMRGIMIALADIADRLHQAARG